MCGIIAIKGEESSSAIRYALTQMIHRGKDDRRFLKVGNLSFGFNRLAINDKSSQGMQPFKYQELIGVFNGEIYNAEKLKITHGIRTQSKSDTEVILPLFKKLGMPIIDYLDGFYSGIIYNTNSKRLFTLRDYIGKKNLFYGYSKGLEFLSSELKAIHQLKKFYLVPKGISELINKRLVPLQAHKISLSPKSKLKSHIIEAVEKRIPLEEPKFGVFLSGGLDSSIIASIISKTHKNATYYTLGDEEFSDFHYVKSLVKELNIKEQLKVISLPKIAELPSLIEKVVFHTESYNPSIVSNGLATYLLSREASKDNLKVVLSGEGADELFCGYHISTNAATCFNKRKELIENLYFTELRRLDMASMAHTIEVRCPFLDRLVFASSQDCRKEDLLVKNAKFLQGKVILRMIFQDDLPEYIFNRRKVSFDVGSGIRKKVVEFLTKGGETEKETLKNIWNKYFPNYPSQDPFFHAYPTFDVAISKRGIQHK